MSLATSSLAGCRTDRGRAAASGDFSQLDVQNVVSTIEALHLQLDVVVLDMNWYRKPDWTGMYSWDRNLLPQTSDAPGALKAKYGLTLLANVHDAQGVLPGGDQARGARRSAGASAGLQRDVALPLLRRLSPQKYRV
jgi:hypothetical protein